MRIVEPSAVVESVTPNILGVIEAAGRTCYKSEARGDAAGFVRMLIGRGHESVLEHGVATIRFVCDRGVSHEMVRHRIASYSQESTRYCNYGKEKFGGEIQVIEPPGLNEARRSLWVEAVQCAERAYLALLADGETPQIARAVLPNCLKTEVVMTANLREWRHFFKLRTAKAAHPQMRHVAILAKVEMAKYVPEEFL